MGMEQPSLIAKQPTPAVPSEQGPGLRFRGVPLMVGVVLLGAAALKGHQLATEPPTGGGFGPSRWLLLVVPGEVLLGLWVLSGWGARRARVVALACFGGFFAISLDRALAGETSCGCFGKLSISPSVSAGIDLFALLGLWFWQPSAAGSGLQRPARLEWCGVLVAVLALAVAGTNTARHPHTASLEDDGRIRGQGVVVLAPETWLGKPFPLLRHINIRERLHVGHWNVLLYRQGCPRCEEELVRYQEMATEPVHIADAPRIAFVEVPHAGGTPTAAPSPSSAWSSGSLTNAREWDLATPLVVRLRDGRVVGVDRAAGTR